MAFKNIKRIIITGQMLKGDITSARWIHSLFAYYIKRVTGLEVYLTTLPTASYFEKDIHIPFNIEKIYHAYDIDFEYKTPYQSTWKDWWAQIYYKTQYNKEAYDYIYSVFKDSLVISYELEDCVLKALEYFDIPYVEMNLDPIRFLEDIMLCFRTNFEPAYMRLLDFRVDEEFLYLNANYVRAFYRTMQKKFFDENNVLFLGQTECDKTLVDESNNEIYSILNHKKEFEDSVRGFDNIFYKRHPKVKNDKEIIDYIRSIGSIKIIDDNFYSLLARNDIKKVVSISSGTCSEARYFGKEVQLLLKEGVKRQTQNKFDEQKYISVYRSFFSLNFWSHILEPFVKTEKFDKTIALENSPNKLRNSRIKSSVYYAYEDTNHLAAKALALGDLSDRIHKSFLAYTLERDGEL